MPSQQDDRENAGDLTIKHLMVLFLRHARQRYCRDGKPGDEFYDVKAALRPLRKLFASTAASGFGPKAFKLVHAMADVTQVYAERDMTLARQVTTSEI